MANKINAKYQEMAKISKALAHPTRMFIIDKLNEKEHCVCELTEMIGVDISTVSKHLSILKNAGIISAEKRSNMVYYNLQCSCVLNIFSCVLDVIQSNIDSTKEMIE
ncbi:MAG: winged helix-turn-helix transcriptional regulator [Candidatus Cloacimonetes bacterium]|nr:winged helix-turn-helix transcriptional regulator [Candidatus Cloacimonadota bacterium]